MHITQTSEQRVLEAFGTALATLRSARLGIGEKTNETKGSRMTPLDHTASRGVAGTTGTTGGTRSITC